MQVLRQRCFVPAYLELSREEAGAGGGAATAPGRPDTNKRDAGDRGGSRGEWRTVSLRKR